MANEQHPNHKYTKAGSKTVRFAIKDPELAESMMGNYERLGYEYVETQGSGHVVMRCSDKIAEKNQKEVVAKHYMQVAPQKMATMNGQKVTIEENRVDIDSLDKILSA